MNEVKKDELLADARPLIGRKVLCKRKENGEYIKTDYTFTSIGRIIEESENKKLKNYLVFGILKNENGKSAEISLKKIIDILLGRTKAKFIELN